MVTNLGEKEEAAKIWKKRLLQRLDDISEGLGKTFRSEYKNQKRKRLVKGLLQIGPEQPSTHLIWLLDFHKTTQGWKFWRGVYETLVRHEPK